MVRHEDQPPSGERGGDEAAAGEQQAEAALRRIDGETRLIEPQAPGHLTRLASRRLEIAPPGGEILARLVVVDEGGVAERALRREAGRQKTGRADGIDALVHQIIAAAARHVAGRSDGDVERTIGEIADRGAEAQIDVGRQFGKPLKLGHQPERGRGGDRQLATLAATGERGGGGGVKRELAVFAVEQRGFQKTFERTYLMADRGRRHAKFLCGAADAEVSGRRLEGRQRVEGNIGRHFY